MNQRDVPLIGSDVKKDMEYIHLLGLHLNGEYLDVTFYETLNMLLNENYTPVLNTLALHRLLEKKTSLLSGKRRLRMAYVGKLL